MDKVNQYIFGGDEEKISDTCISCSEFNGTGWVTVHFVFLISLYY